MDKDIRVQLFSLSQQDADRQELEARMLSTIRACVMQCQLRCATVLMTCAGMRGRHRGDAGGTFNTYHILDIQRIQNKPAWDNYWHRRNVVARENNNDPNEHMLFHGSMFVDNIVEHGFDERFASISGMFGAGARCDPSDGKVDATTGCAHRFCHATGVYFAEDSSKSNQYVYGMLGGSGCSAHSDKRWDACDTIVGTDADTHTGVQLQDVRAKDAHVPSDSGPIVRLQVGSKAAACTAGTPFCDRVRSGARRCAGSLSHCRCLLQGRE